MSNGGAIDTSPPVHVFTTDCLRKATCSDKVTPFITSLPVQFERCYSSGTWTVPSHASLLTGQTVLDHKISATGDTATRQDAILPETAKANGYRTAIFSENPSFSPRAGFGYYIDEIHENIQRKPFPATFSPREFLDGFDAKSVLNLSQELLTRPNRLRNIGNTAYIAYNHIRQPEPAYPHNGKWVFSHLQSFLANATEPTLTVTNVLEPHNPYWGSPPSIPRSRPKRERDALRSAGNNLRYLLTDADPPGIIDAAFDGWDGFFATKATIYRDFSREADRLLRNWRRKQQDQFDDALIVIVGDHGQLLGAEEMIGHHNSLHPHGIHVPLAIDPPNSWDRTQRTISQPVSVAGLGNALIEVVDGEITSSDSLVGAITGNRSESDEGVVICADGPTWSLPPLYEAERFDDELIDQLAVRKVGYVRNQCVDVYSSQWEDTAIEATSYKYTENGRERLPERDPPPVPDKAEVWLKTTRDPRSERQATKTDQLRALGYA